MFIHSVSHAVPKLTFPRPTAFMPFSRLPVFISSNHLHRNYSNMCWAETMASNKGICALKGLRKLLKRNPMCFTNVLRRMRQSWRLRRPSWHWIRPSSSRSKSMRCLSPPTGYLCPGLTSYVADNLKIPADHVLLDLVGHGCGAAVPNLRQARRAHRLSAGQKRTGMR